MGEIEIWIYRGLIVGLVGIVIKFLSDKYQDQKDRNDEFESEHASFNESLNKLTVSVDKLNNTLENQQAISKLQHEALDARLISHKDRMLNYDTRLLKLEDIVTENSMQIRVLIEKIGK